MNKRLNNLRKIILLSTSVFIFSCQNTQINSKASNTTDSNLSENINQVLKVKRANYGIFLGSKKGEIEIEYEQKKVLVSYETETIYQENNFKATNKSKIKEIFYSQDITKESPLFMVFPYDEPLPLSIPRPEGQSDKDYEDFFKNSESNKNKTKEILSDLKKLKGSESENELILISINLIEGKELNLFIETIDLNPGQSKDFIEFTKISDKDFKLVFKNNEMFISLKDSKTNSIFYIKEGVFTINENGLVIHKESGYSLEPAISLSKEQILTNINNLGQVYIKYNFNSQESLISELFASRFKNPEKLKQENGFYVETENSGKPDVINLKEISFKEELKFKK